MRAEWGDAIYLEFLKVNWRDGLDRRTTENWLDGQAQRIALCGSKSNWGWFLQTFARGWYRDWHYVAPSLTVPVSGENPPSANLWMTPSGGQWLRHCKAAPFRDAPWKETETTWTRLTRASRSSAKQMRSPTSRMQQLHTAAWAGAEQVRGQLCKEGVGAPSEQVGQESAVSSCRYEGKLHPGLF